MRNGLCLWSPVFAKYDCVVCVYAIVVRLGVYIPSVNFFSRQVNKDQCPILGTPRCHIFETIQASLNHNNSTRTTGKLQSHLYFQMMFYARFFSLNLPFLSKRLLFAQRTNAYLFIVNISKNTNKKKLKKKQTQISRNARADSLGRI